MTDAAPGARAVLVAGGAGFLGSHLCERLLDDGERVVCVDNLATGSAANVSHLLSHPAFTFVEADVSEPLPDLPPLSGIYHLASPASPDGYTRLQLETLRANASGTDRLLDLAVRHGAALLYASTSEVYGDPLVHPQTEDYRGNVSTIGPRSMYDEAKRYGEALVTAWARTRGANTRIVRLFNTYGPRMHRADGRLIPAFFSQALSGEPITVHGDGRQTRSLCYVTDTVDGLVRALRMPAARDQVINIGNPDERTVLEFAGAVRRVASSDSPIVFVPHSVGDDPRRRCPDIGRARSLLGWTPRVPLDEGLARVCEWLRAAGDAQPVGVATAG